MIVANITDISLINEGSELSGLSPTSTTSRAVCLAGDLRKRDVGQSSRL